MKQSDNLFAEYFLYLAGHSIMTVIVTSKVIAKRVKNIVARRWDSTDSSTSKQRRNKKLPDQDSTTTMKVKKKRKKRQKYSGSPITSPLTSSLSSLSSSSESSVSPPSSPSKSSHNVLKKPHKRKQPIESSDYDESDNGYSEIDSSEDTSYSISRCGKR